MEAAVRPTDDLTENARQQISAEHPFVIPDPATVPTFSGLGPNPVQIPRPEPGTADSSSITTLPRLASVRGSNSGSPEENERPRTNAQGVPESAELVDRRRSSESFSGPVIRSDSMAEQEVVVLTPSRLRLDSRVVVGHATLQWLTNMIWALLIWQKLEQRLHWSWWAVFSPTIVNHALHIPMQVLVFLSANHMIYKQIGPPPPLSASPGLVLQYAIIHHVRLRSHRVDWANNALESVCVFITKMLFCDALHRGVFDTVSLRLIFTPIWVCWVLTVALLCFKDRSERMFGSSRDLFFMFLLFVAFKADDQAGWKKVQWRVVFLVPWMWFSGLMLVAVLVMLLLIFAKVWARPRELLLPIGFMLLLLSTLPQFLSYIALVRRLDDDRCDTGQATDTGCGTSYQSILLPNALSWFLMWLSALLIGWALRHKERLRDMLLARGAVWTAHEAVARRLHAEREEAQRRVDEMSEDEVSRLVESMMAGKSKPGRLRRVGENLYKRIASLEPALAEQAAQNAVQAVGLEGGCAAGDDPQQPQSQSQSQLLLRNPSATAAANANPAAGDPPQFGGNGWPLGGLLAIKHNRVAPGPGVGVGVAGVAPGTEGAGGAEGGAGAVSGPAAAGTGGALAAGAAATRSGRWLVGTDTGSGSRRGERISPASPATLACPPGEVGSLELQRLDLERGEGSFRIGTQVLPDSPPPAAAVAALGDPPVPGEVPGDIPLVGVPERTSDNRQQHHHQQQQQQQQQPQLSHSSLTALGAATATTTTTASTNLTIGGGGGGGGRAVVVAAAILRPSSSLRRPRLAPMTAAPPPGEKPAEGPDGRGGAVAAAAAAVSRPLSGGVTRGPPQRQSASLEPPAEAADVAAAPVAAVAAAQPTPGAAPGDDGRLVTASAGGGGAGDAAGGDHRARQAAAAAPSAGAATAASTVAEAVSGAASGTDGRRSSAEGSDGGVPAAAAPRGSAGAAAAGSAASPSAAAAGAGSPRRSPAVLPTAEGDGENAAVEASAAVDAAAAEAAAVNGSAAAASSAASSASGLSRDEGLLHKPKADGASGQDNKDKNAGRSSSGGADGGGSLELENACVICYDNEATCVFLECGHGGFCRRCAFLLFVRPPNECPTCRQLIDQVVEIEEAAPVGEVAKVK